MPKKNNVRIMSIDPGTSLLGWAVLDYNTVDKTITVIQFGDLEGNALVKRYAHLEFAGRRYTVLEALYDTLSNMVMSFKPNVLVSEDAFFDPRRPAAFQSLSLVVQVLRRVAANFLGKALFTYSPREIKKAVTESGGAGKLTVQDSVKAIVNLKNTKQTSPEKLSEHSADAIAAGVTLIKNDLPMILQSTPELIYYTNPLIPYR